MKPIEPNCEAIVVAVGIEKAKTLIGTTVKVIDVAPADCQIGAKHTLWHIDSELVRQICNDGLFPYIPENMLMRLDGFEEDEKQEEINLTSQKLLAKQS